MSQTYKHWKLQHDKDQILWLIFDRQGKSVNALSEEVVLELNDIIASIEKDGSVRGVILKSGKTKGFIAGADIETFLHYNDENEVYKMVRQAQTIFDRLEALKIPTVAMINGFCLGGGTELALACHYRIADEDQAKIGLPEVKLGIHPGWGGTVRTPKLMGALQAMDLILTGKAISAKAAKKSGLVDESVPLRQLERAARYYVLNRPPRRKATFMQRMTDQAWIRPILGKMMRNKLAQKISPEHYPAPFAVVDTWVKNGVYSKNAMEQEAKSFAKVFMTDTARNLVRVFFLQEKMKGLSKGIEFKPKHVHVIGAGTMGGDIAAWCALQGMTVTLQDREMKFIAPAIARAAKLYKKKLKLPRLIQAAMDRLMPDVDGTGVKKADVIIEAIFENKEAKQKLYQELEPQMKKEALLATNTSSLPLDELNTILKDPARLVGIHFFNPVAQMMLVEVVKGEKTDPAVVDKAIAFVRAIDKLPLPVKSDAGFLVNRVLIPALIEAIKMMEEGVPAPLIDKAATQFGLPMGPIELADTVGLDICLHVAEILTAHYGGDIPAILKQKVTNKELGRKTGQGFYKYENGKVIKGNAGHGTSPISRDVITDRMVLAMLNVAVACLREKIVADSDLLDGGMIFGTGFAPFRGGPIHYAQTRGIDNIVNRLEEFSAQYGERFKPDAGWKDLTSFSG